MGSSLDTKFPKVGLKFFPEFLQNGSKILSKISKVSLKFCYILENSDCELVDGLLVSALFATNRLNRDVKSSILVGKGILVAL